MLPTEYQSRPLTPEEEAALLAASGGGGMSPTPVAPPAGQVAVAPGATQTTAPAAPPPEYVAPPPPVDAGAAYGMGVPASDPAVVYTQQQAAAPAPGLGGVQTTVPQQYTAPPPPTGSAGGGSAYYGGLTSGDAGSAYSNPNLVTTTYPASGSPATDMRDIRTGQTGQALRYGDTSMYSAAPAPASVAARPTINTGNGGGVGNIERPGGYRGSSSVYGGRGPDSLTTQAPVAGDAFQAAGRGIGDRLTQGLRAAGNLKDTFEASPEADLLAEFIQGVPGPGGGMVRGSMKPGNVSGTAGALRGAASRLADLPAVTVDDIARLAAGVADELPRGVTNGRSPAPPRTQPGIKETVGDPYPTRDPAVTGESTSEQLPSRQPPAETVVDTRVSDLVKREQAAAAAERELRLRKREASIAQQEGDLEPGGRYTPEPLDKGLANTKGAQVILPSEIASNAFDVGLTGRSIRNATNPVTNAVARAAEMTPSWKTAAALSAIPAAIGVGKWGNAQLDKAGLWRDETAVPALQEAGDRVADILPGGTQAYPVTEPGMYQTPSNMEGELEPWRELSRNYLPEPVGEVEQALRDHGIAADFGWGLGPSATAAIQGVEPVVNGTSQQLRDWGVPSPQDVVDTAGRITPKDVTRRLNDVANSAVGQMVQGGISAAQTLMPPQVTGGVADTKPRPYPVQPGEYNPSARGLSDLNTTDLGTRLANPTDRARVTTAKDGILYLNDGPDGGPGTPVGIGTDAGWDVRGSDESLETFWADAEAAGVTQPTGAGGAGKTIYDGFNDMPQAAPSSPSTTSTGRGGGGSTPAGPSGGGYTPRSSGGSYTPSGGGSTPTGSSRRGSSVGEMFDEDDDFGLNERDFTEKDYDGDGRISAKDRSVGRKRYQSELSKRRKKKGKTTSFSNVPQREDSPIRTKVLSAIDQSVNKKKTKR